jgi:hypothetical protein
MRSSGIYALLFSSRFARRDPVGGPQHRFQIRQSPRTVLLLHAGEPLRALERYSRAVFEVIAVICLCLEARASMTVVSSNQVKNQIAKVG